MNCHSVKLSSGVRSSEVGGLNAVLIALDDRLGSRMGIKRMTNIAAIAESKTKIAGRSLGRSLKEPSGRFMNCEANMLIYSISKDFGVVIGRYMVMIKQAKAHDAAG